MNSREQFENMQNRLGVSTRKNAAGVYMNKGTRSAWFGWQASREALVVKLPDPIEVQDTGDFMCCVIDELEQLGVRYE